MLKKLSIVFFGTLIGLTSLTPLSNSQPFPQPPQLRFIDLQPFSSGGNFEGRTWQKNQPLYEVMRLMDLWPNKTSITLKQILNWSNQNPEKYSLKSFSLIFSLTFQELVNLTQINNYKGAEIKPIKEYLESLNINPEQSLTDILEQHPEISEQKLGKNFENYPLNSIPNLISIPISQFPNWQQVPIGKIPGLIYVPLYKLTSLHQSPLSSDKEFKKRENPKIIVENPFTGWASIDLIWGPNDKPASRTISGGYNVGFNIPCTINCAHIEITGNPSINGKQWISGDFQQVDGGFGCLKWVNGGKEPTGRHPYGSVFKVVIRNLNETTDTATADVFSRWCNECGCTPYYLYTGTLEIWHTGNIRWIGLD